LHSGHEIVIADREPAKLSNALAAKYFSINISCPEDLDGLMQDIDLVYHLASNSDVRNKGADERDTFRTTQAVLESMRKYHVKRLVFTSSSTVYGIGDITWSENHPLKPISEYGKAKKMSENLIKSECIKRDLNAVILRLANVVGEGQTRGVAVDFIRKLQQDPTSLKIMGNGKQTKEYVHIFDVLSAMRVVTEINPSFEIYNVSSSTSLSVIEIADIICNEMGLENVEYICEDKESGWEGDVPRYSLDTSKLKSTGWTYQYDSISAIKSAVSHFNHLK